MCRFTQYCEERGGRRGRLKRGDAGLYVHFVTASNDGSEPVLDRFRETIEGQCRRTCGNVSLQDGVEDFAPAYRVGPAERVVVIGLWGITQAVKDRRRQVLGPHYAPQRG